MKRLLAVLFAAALALPVAADTQVVCTITAQSNTACSAISVSKAAQLDACRCSPNGDGGGAEPSVYDDAVALWKLDEASGTRADSIGSLDLTDNNTVGSTSKGVDAPANLPDTVASFVAANSESLTGTALSELTDNFTVSFWINPANSTRWGIWNNGINASPFGFTVEINVFGAGDLLLFATSDGLQYVYTNTGLLTVDGSTWNHVVIVYNTSESSAADKAKVWINGVSATMNTGAGTPVAHTVGNAFGLGRRATDRYYGGLMSTVAYWGSVKDQAFVDSLYNSGDGAVLP